MVLTQIVRESTLSNVLKPGDPDFDNRAAARQSEIAWNLCTAIFYKVGGRPLESLRNPRRRMVRGPRF